jgi:hemerythrin-like domain-containing protein
VITRRVVFGPTLGRCSSLRLGTYPAPLRRVSSEPTTRPGFETVTGYLCWDHARLAGLLERVKREVDAGRMKDARELYRDYDAGISRHVRVEHELLYPLFEARSGISSGPTVTLRQEHEQVQRAIRMMREGLAALDASAFRAGVRYLEETLPPHNSKEEHVLYPTMDTLLSDKERRALSDRLQRE